MRIASPILGLALSGLLASSMAAVPAAAQGLNLITPTEPTIGRLLGLQTGQQFVLKPSRNALELSRSAEPRRLQVCVTTGTTPASNNVAARVITDQGDRVVPVGHCRVVEGTSIAITPAGHLGGNQRVKGMYAVVS